MTNISDKQVINTGLPTREPYRLPEGAVDNFNYKEPVVTNDPHTEESSASGALSGDLAPPTNLEIESQTVRIAPDGGAVIDIVLSFDAAANATGNEVRMSKL